MDALDASPLTRGRELKHRAQARRRAHLESPLTRGRELKLTEDAEDHLSDSRPLRGGVN